MNYNHMAGIGKVSLLNCHFALKYITGFSIDMSGLFFKLCPAVWRINTRSTRIIEVKLSFVVNIISLLLLMRKENIIDTN